MNALHGNSEYDGADGFPLSVGRWPRPLHFEVYRDNAGLWRWRLVAGNGAIIGDSSEGYASKWNAKRALFRVAAAAGKAALR